MSNTTLQSLPPVWTPWIYADIQDMDEEDIRRLYVSLLAKFSMVEDCLELTELYKGKRKIDKRRTN